MVVSDREHNSNLVVWQRLAAERGIRIEVLPLPDTTAFDAETLEAHLGSDVRLVSLFHTSNLDGRTLPVQEITERAHDRGALVLFDGCQAAPHRKVELDRMGVDFYAVSAHKMLGPTGVGVLAATPDALAPLRPLLLGGETVERTTLEGHVLRPPPYRFEAGLQNYAGVIGAHAAMDYLTKVGLDAVEAQQRAVNSIVSRALEEEPRLHLLGPSDPADRPSIFAFTLDGIDPHDAALFLDEGHGVMVRFRTPLRALVLRGARAQRQRAGFVLPLQRPRRRRSPGRGDPGAPGACPVRPDYRYIGGDGWVVDSARPRSAARRWIERSCFSIRSASAYSGTGSSGVRKRIRLIVSITFAAARASG